MAKKGKISVSFFFFSFGLRWSRLRASDKQHSFVLVLLKACRWVRTGNTFSFVNLSYSHPLWCFVFYAFFAFYAFFYSMPSWSFSLLLSYRIIFLSNYFPVFSSPNLTSFPPSLDFFSSFRSFSLCLYPFLTSCFVFISHSLTFFWAPHFLQLYL